LHCGAEPDEQTTVGAVVGGTTAVVDLGGSELLKLRHPASASGSNIDRRTEIRILRFPFV